MSLKPAPKIQNSQIHQRYDVATLSAKSERVQYRKGQQGEEDRKTKKSRKDAKSERKREGYQRKKVNLVVRENSGFETNIYHHII